MQGVRDCILQCEKVEGHRQIPEDHYDEYEELAAEHIVCCSCGNEEADDDNDILLCDGHGCSRAYHVQCLPFKDDFILQVPSLPSFYSFLLMPECIDSWSLLDQGGSMCIGSLCASSYMPWVSGEQQGPQLRSQGEGCGAGAARFGGWVALPSM